MVDIEKKVTLLCTEGGSDKQYTMWLQRESDDLWTVQSQYGPRGGWVQSAAKTPKPVPRDKAEQVYEKVLREKRAKGYHEGADAPAFSQVAGATDSGLRPMLLTVASEDSLDRLVEDNEWGAQTKINGKRIMLKADGELVQGSNRRGLVCPIPAVLEKALRGRKLELDGELVGDVYHVFDQLVSEGVDLRSHPLKSRFEKAEKIIYTINQPCLRLVELVVEEKAKRALVKRLRDGRMEGVVFKKLDATYQPGRIETLEKALAVKVKFTTEGTFVTLRWNDKQSIEVGALLADGKKTVSVGNVTVPKKYAEQIGGGSLVRVRYLYVTDANQLYQPRLDPTDDGKVTRDDQTLKNIVKVSELKHEGKADN